VTGGDIDIADIDPQTTLSVNSAIAIEKEIAADTIGTIFACTRSHFLPFLEECTLELGETLNHYYEGIRKSGISSLFEFIKTFYELSESPTWEAGATIVRKAYLVLSGSHSYPSFNRGCRSTTKSRNLSTIPYLVS